MNFETFVPDILATVVGGIILTSLFFFAREKLFPLPNITGKWYMQMNTINTSYNPYQNMILRYVVMIWTEGNRVQGTVEKFYENSITGERTFEGQNRVRGTIKGYIEKKYIGTSNIFLHIIENGLLRESTHFYTLTENSTKKLNGTFSSTIANQEGTVFFQREPF